MFDKKNYYHSVTFDEKTKQAIIVRLLSDGTTNLLTVIDLNIDPAEAEEDQFNRLAVRIGEALMFDSPACRRILDI